MGLLCATLLTVLPGVGAEGPPEEERILERRLESVEDQSLVQERGGDVLLRRAGELEADPRKRYFAEAGHGSTVFVLDVSDHMRTEPRGGDPLSKAFARAASKVTWAANELLRALEGLPESSRFGLVAFHGRVSTFRSELRPASTGERRAALRFVRGLTTKPGRDLFAGLHAAFRYEDAETVAVMTDAAVAPREQLEPQLLALNYLRGTRLILYGFAKRSPEKDESLGLLERLASTHFGWYRVILWNKE